MRGWLASEPLASATSNVFIILKDFMADLPSADSDPIAFLHAHGPHEHGASWHLDDVIVHP